MTPAQAALQAALSLQQRGNLAAAESAYRDLLQQFGPDPDAEHMLGVTLHAMGRSEEALPWFERAAQARGGAMFWNNHAAALLAVGRVDEAVDLARRVVSVDPTHAGGWLNLGLAYEIKSDFPASASALFQSVAAQPKNLGARRALARVQLAAKDAAAASATLRVIPVGVDSAADLLRAEILIAQEEWDEAVTLLDRLEAKDFDRPHVLSLQAEISLQRGQSDQALAQLAAARYIDPECRRAVVKEALVRIGRGEIETGLPLLRTWLDRHPDDNASAGSYLVACNDSERFDPPALLAEHRSLQPVTSRMPQWKERSVNGSGRLRVGWVSTAFSVGPMEIFCADVMRALPATATDLSHHLYAIGGESTSAPRSTSWAIEQRDLSGLSNAQIVEAIRSDELDVLVDMVGRAAGNRISVFAARAAPTQIGWLDVFYPSGLDTMDFLITDSWLSPPGADAHFSEKLLRLPHGRLAYRPPPVGATNADAAKLKRFVSLNRFSKANDAVIDVWTAILRALPDWSLLLKARGRDDDLAARFLTRFESAGIDPARVAIEDGGTYAEAMATYDRASIALDPFPFSGCSTTCDALWMGLPVITWPRETIASRQTAAWLEMAGKPEWIANDADSYVALAIELANDEPAQLDWRRHARDVLRPTICDSARLAHELAEAIRAAAVSRR